MTGSGLDFRMATPATTGAIISCARSEQRQVIIRAGERQSRGTSRLVKLVLLSGPGIRFDRSTRGLQRGGDVMIKRFGSLYAGHVDFEDLGYDATPVNARSLPNEHLITAFDKARAIAETM